MKKKLVPYQNWTDKELRYALKVHVSRLDLTGILTNLLVDIIDEAFESKYWVPVRDFNGCSVVQDTFHPSPACFVHDYMWNTGHGGKISDRIFLHLMIAQGVTKSKAKRRWFAVRFGWYTYFMWKYIFNKKFMNPTIAMTNLNNHFKK